MSLFDDIYQKASDSIKNADAGDVINGAINAYIKVQQAQAQQYVKVGPTPTGNLTPEQIAQGLTGQTAPVAPPASGFMQTLSQNQSMLPVIALVGVGAYFVMKKMKK